MKKLSIVCLSGLLFLTACGSGGSSTIGTYEKEETSKSSEKSEGESHNSQGAQEKENRGSARTTTDTTLKTSGDAPQQGSGAEIKTGANVATDSMNNKATRP